METNTNICTTKLIEARYKFNEAQQTQILNAVHDFLSRHGNAYEANHVLSEFYTTFLESKYLTFKDVGDNTEAEICYKEFTDITSTYQSLHDLCLKLDRATLKETISY